MKKLFTLLLLFTLLIGAGITHQTNPGISTVVTAITADKPKYKYWINDLSKKRHNKNCRYYGKTKKGHYTNKAEGVACKICGG